jgi:hypothetical protein
VIGRTTTKLIVFLLPTFALLLAAATAAEQPKFDAPLGEPLDPRAEQEAFEQYDASAAQLQKAAVEKLIDAVDSAKVAIIDDDRKDAHQKRAVNEVIEALNKIEEAARDAKKAASFAADLKQLGIVTQPTYDPEAVTKALESMRKRAAGVAATSSGTEFNETQQLYLKLTDLEIRSINELGEAVKAAQAAGMKDPLDIEGRMAKEEEALDHAKRALGGFERVQGTAISAGGMKHYEEGIFISPYFVPYGRNSQKYAEPIRPRTGSSPMPNYPGSRVPSSGVYGQ